MKPAVTIAPPGDWPRVAAEWLAQRIAQTVSSRGRCRLALAGGNTPLPVYEALATPPLSTQVDWSKVDVFFGDERCVPPDDAASNYALAQRALLSRIPVPSAQVFRIAGELPPPRAAAEYDAVLGATPLDVVLLGLGDDGHTASIFPGTVEAAGRRVIATTSPKPPTHRVSLTTQALNEAREVVFLATGATKADIVAEVFTQWPSSAPPLPAARVRPNHGSPRWILDAPAASKLS